MSTGTPIAEGTKIVADDGLKITAKRYLAGDVTLTADIAERPEVKLLLDAALTITGDRLDSYGQAEDSFELIAQFWTSYMAVRPRPGVVTAEDVANMLVLFKMARQAYAPKRDNYVDMAGYAGLAERIVVKGAGS